jgi:hypothetical protein
MDNRFCLVVGGGAGIGGTVGRQFETNGMYCFDSFD